MTDLALPRVDRVNDKVLLKQFRADPGTAFLDVIRGSTAPLNARKVKETVITAGARRSDVDRHWKRLQPFLQLHPYIRKPTNLLYEWSVEPVPSSVAVDLLASRMLASTPGWLKSALVAVVTDSLAAAETTGVTAQSSWNDQRRLEKAQVLAEAAAQLEMLLLDRKDNETVLSWLSTEVADAQLAAVAHVGERIAFDPKAHDVVGRAPTRGATVEVVRPGYRWLGGRGEPVVVRPVVRWT